MGWELAIHGEWEKNRLVNRLKIVFLTWSQKNIHSTELQKCGILVSRIPDIFKRKSGHFKIFSANLPHFSQKYNNTLLFHFNSTPNKCD